MSLPDLAASSWLWLALAAVCVGFAKTAISGVNALAVVIFASVLPSRESTGALLPLLLFGDVLALSTYRRHADTATLLRLVPGVVPGLVLGAVFVSLVDDDVMRVSIGAILLVLTVMQLWQRRPSAPAAEAPAAAPSATPPSPAVTRPTGRFGGPIAATLMFGAVAGFTTMTANAGGPVMTLYLLAAGLPMLRLLGTAAWFFFAVNLAKLPFSIGLGLISWSSLTMDVVLIPPMLVGAVVGVAVIRRIQQRHFELAALSLCAFAATLLLV